MSRLRLLLAAAAAALLTAAPSQGAFMVAWNFSGASDTTFKPGSLTSGTGASPSNLTHGSGVNLISPGFLATNAFNASNWTNTNALDPLDYNTITITPTSSTISLGTINLSEQSNNRGPQKGTIRTSLDNFTNDVFTWDMPNQGTADSQSFNFGAAFANITTAIEIRIYAHKATANDTASEYALTALNVSGGSTPLNAVPVPPTALAALCGMPMLGAFGYLRRRKVAAA